MTWIDVDEPFAAPPRSAGPLSAPGADGVVDMEDRWGTVAATTLKGELDAGACDRLEIEASELRGVSIRSGATTEIDLRASELIDCDLTGLRLRSVLNTRLVGCKLSGADLSGAIVRDVEFERCLLRMTSVRMAEVQRVAFRNCTLDELDLYDSSLAEVSFDGTELRQLEADQTRFHHVDLRGAKALDFRSCTRLVGCLLRPEQVLEVAYVLARVAGVSIAAEEGSDRDKVQT